MWKQAGWLAKKHGVSRITIGNWIRDSKYEKVERTKGGHYRVWIETDIETIGYCRVSSAKQKSSLVTQEAIIQKAYPGIEIVSDVGSGFNFKRKSFRALLERSLSGSPVSVVVSTGDRLARSGLPLIRWAIELHGGSVIELEKSDSPEGFDTAILVGFITSFIASYHGKRSQKRRSSEKSSGIP